MKIQFSKKGFTLIEIIIVIIIVGVLASLALPRLTAQIDKSRAAEALNSLGSISRAIDRCMTARTPSAVSVALCDEWSELDIADPSNATFTYTIAEDTTNFDFDITATGPDVDGNGNAADDTIVFTYDPADGSVVKAANGGYSSIPLQ